MTLRQSVKIFFSTKKIQMFAGISWENQSKAQMYNFLPLRDQNTADMSINAASFCFIEPTDTFSKHSVSNLKQISISADPQNFASVNLKRSVNGFSDPLLGIQFQVTRFPAEKTSISMFSCNALEKLKWIFWPSKRL